MSGRSMFTKSCQTVALYLERLSLILAGTLLVVNVGTILFAVISRYVFRSSFMWTEELARYTLIYFVLLAANAAWRKGEHMKIELFEKFLPKPIKVVVDWAKRGIIVFLLGFMTVEGYAHAMRAANHTTVGLGISRSVPLLAIPIGMGLLLLQFVLTELSGGNGNVPDQNLGKEG